MVVNPTNVYKPSCHPLLFKQTQHSQTVDRMFTGRSLQAYVVGPSGVTLPIGRCKCHKNCMTTSFIKDITIDIHRPQIPKCSLECSSNAHHQMYPKYPGKKRSWFSSSIRPHLENNIGLFIPKERHTSLLRWPYQKDSWQGLELSRENLWTNLLKWYITSNHYIIYINHHISYAFGIISLQWPISNYIWHVLYHCILYVWYSVYFIYIFSYSIAIITYDLLHIWTINIIITYAILNIKN